MPTKTRRWRLLEQMDDWLQVPMLILSLLWLMIVLAELMGAGHHLLAVFGTVIWVIFIVEFLVRLALAPTKIVFLRRNWLTILALAVPAFRLFRSLAILRAARGLRGLRLVRIIGTANRSMNALKSTLRRRGFGYVAGLTLLVIALGAAGMLSFEPAAEVDGGFTGYGHALWWTAMLVASIGTDFWPITVEGRILSSLLALYGLAVFGYVAATFASFFIGNDARSASGEIAGGAEIASLKREILLLREALTHRNLIS